MARDYKATRRTGQSERFGSWLSFITGLGIGLVVAVLAYYWSLETQSSRRSKAQATPSAASEPAEDSSNPDPFEQQQAVIPKFDFYKILPEIEVKVPEAEITSPTPPPTVLADAAPEAATYILQAGSYQRFEDADQAKAQLALQGVQANIQRVVINGQDVWHRVHIGPFRSVGDVRVVRAKLTQLGMNAIVLKIGGGER